MNTKHSLHTFFEPRSVAIIGASSDPDRIGGRALRYLMNGGFKGKIFPINARHNEVQGLKAWKSVSSVTEDIDQAIIIVPAEDCISTLLECASKNIKAVQIFSSGFAEVGSQGQRLQDELIAIANSNGIRILGPNSIGLISVENQYFGTFSSSLNALIPEAGGIALATQSGAFGAFTYSRAIQRGMKFSRIVATGNEADIDLAECIDYFSDDPKTRTICAAFEGCKDGNRLRQALLKAAKNGKAVVVMKVGASEIGGAAAATHTGSLAGHDWVFDTVLRECGAIRAQSVEAMLDIAYLNETLPTKPTNNKLGVVTVSGGIGVLLADEAEKHKLELPVLSDSLTATLANLLPFASIKNPLDTTAQIGTIKNGQVRALEVLITETDWSTFVVFLPPSGCLPERFEPIRRALGELRLCHPAARVILVGVSVASVREQVARDGFAFMDDPSRAMAAAGALVELSNRWDSLYSVEDFSSSNKHISGRLTETDAKDILSSYGLPVLNEQVCGDATTAVNAAIKCGFPVVAKVVSADIPHKTEVGGVVLNLRSAEEVGHAFEEIMTRARTLAPSAKLDGILISPMINDGVDTILGIHIDDVFGPMIMFGSGGTAVELYKDVAFASAPLSKKAAYDLIGRVQGSKLLTGWRGSPRLDIEALVSTLTLLSKFAFDHQSSITGLDINPLRVREKGVVCLDAMISTSSD